MSRRRWSWNWNREHRRDGQSSRSTKTSGWRTRSQQPDARWSSFRRIRRTTTRSRTCVKSQNAIAGGSGPHVRSGRGRDWDCVALDHARGLRRVLSPLWIRRAAKLRNALVARNRPLPNRSIWAAVQTLAGCYDYVNRRAPRQSYSAIPLRQIDRFGSGRFLQLGVSQLGSASYPQWRKYPSQSSA